MRIIATIIASTRVKIDAKGKISLPLEYDRETIKMVLH